jgi:hypothetical protein
MLDLEEEGTSFEMRVYSVWGEELREEDNYKLWNTITELYSDL